MIHLCCGVELEGVDDLGVVTDLTDEALLATQGAVVDVLRRELYDLGEAMSELVLVNLEQVLRGVKKGMFYKAQYPVRWTTQSALHFTP